MRESDEQFLARFRAEIEPLVSTLGSIVDVRLEDVAVGERVRIVVGVVGRAGPVELVLEGDSLVDAAAGWPARIGEAGLALAFRELVLTHGR
jgi:hypothetical protein